MSIFITSDLHLGHERVISRFDRPFKNVRQMNEILIKNWNKTVGILDKVYFLGDLSFRSFNTEYWIPKLNGDIIFIKGNHDWFDYMPYYNNLVIKHDENYFYLVHDSQNIPQNWRGWSICGHNHNERPFFDKTTKRFNISTDVTNFKPVNMNYISYLIRK